MSGVRVAAGGAGAPSVAPSAAVVGAGGAGAGAGGGSGLTLRLRSRAGLWRVEGLSPSSTIAEVKARLRDEKGIDVAGQVLSFRSKGDALPDGSTLAALGAEHGTMLFLEFTGDVAPATAERMVDKDGRIVPVSHEEARKTSGFRPGMAAMRDLQKQWTWTDFMDLQRSLEFDVKKQKAPRCSRVTLDTEAATDFVSYVSDFAFQQRHIGYLYGFFTEDKYVRSGDDSGASSSTRSAGFNHGTTEAVVVTIYDPPQIGTDTRCELLEDEHAPHLNAVAELLGLERVGVIFSHPPRDKSVVFSAPEVFMAARAQQEANAAGRPFVAVKVTGAPETGDTAVEAFELTELGLDMITRDAVALHPEKPTQFRTNPKFQVIVEAKPAAEIGVEFFILPIAIAQETYFLHTRFPRASRSDGPLTARTLRTHLNTVGKRAGFVESLRDLHALVYIAAQPFLAEAVPSLCDCVLDPDRPLEEGYEALIREFADS